MYWPGRSTCTFQFHSSHVQVTRILPPPTREKNRTHVQTAVTYPRTDPGRNNLSCNGEYYLGLRDTVCQCASVRMRF